jgi:hypothetical protein
MQRVAKLFTAKRGLRLRKHLKQIAFVDLRALRGSRFVAVVSQTAYGSVIWILPPSSPASVNEDRTSAIIPGG